jgi:hypothetical protein
MKHEDHFVLVKSRTRWALVAHTCNPSYLGGLLETSPGKAWEAVS